MGAAAASGLVGALGGHRRLERAGEPRWSRSAGRLRIGGMIRVGPRHARTVCSGPRARAILAAGAGAGVHWLVLGVGSWSLRTRLLHRFMLEGTGRSQGWMRAGPRLRAVVEVDEFNMISGDYGARAGFDLVFCRNALIYFTHTHRRRVLQGLVRALAPGGLIVLGPSDHAPVADLDLEMVGPAMFRQKGQYATLEPR